MTCYRSTARSLVVPLLSAILLLHGATHGHAQGPRAAGVEVDRVDTFEFLETRPVIGRFTPVNRSVVASRVSGVVKSVKVVAGTRVEEGQVIATLDGELKTIEFDAASAALREKQALLEVAKAEAALAKQQYDRAARLQNSAAFSRSRFEDLEKEVQTANGRVTEVRAQMETAQAEVARQTYRIRNTAIRAPFDGIVLERTAQPGAYIDIGDAIITLLDDKHLEIEADVPSELVYRLVTGVVVDAALSGTNETLQAQVRAVIPDERATTRTRAARFTPILPDGMTQLASGQAVIIDVPAMVARDVLTVAKDALIQSGGQWVVFVASDGVADRRTVEIGQSVEGRVEIVSGLNQGDLVVVRGNERLFPGQPIAYEAPAPKVSALGTNNASGSAEN